MILPKQACLGFFAALALGLLACPAVALSQDALPRAVLIIDGSGSMWGRIDNREKIVIAREQLAERIKLLKAKADLGVMSYGHRRRRDCRDIEMIVPIGPVDPGTYGETIKRLLPRGKTPVASALNMAAQAINSTKGKKGQKSHIILVADGLENCRLDPCTTAASLASDNPRLTIDVIGFGISQSEAEQLQCISRATSGRFHKADNSVQLAAAIELAFAAIGPTKSPVTKAKKSKPKIAPGLYLSAGLAKDGAIIDRDIGWRIYRAGESSKTSATPLHRKTSATPVLRLPKGKYHVEVRHGPLIAEQDVTIEGDAATKTRLSFNRGIITANARLGRDAPVSSDIIFSLYNANSGDAGPGTIIAHKQQKEAVFYLPPGKYTLKARANETEARQDFTLKAGDHKNHTLLLDAGQIKLTASLAKDQPPLQDVQYTIFQRGQKEDVEFVRTLDPTPVLILPAGQYFVLANKGSSSSYGKLSIHAGETKKVSLVLNAGTLNLTSNLDERADGAAPDRARGAKIAYTIEAIKPTRPKTVKISDQKALDEFDQALPTRSFRNSFILPEGEYLVHALYGNSNAQAVARVQIKAGEVSQQKISLSAGRVRLQLALSLSDPPLPGVFWTILDKQGKQVASASSITPKLTLSSGSYEVIADYLGQSYRRKFDLQNGQDKKIQLKVQ